MNSRGELCSAGRRHATRGAQHCTSLHCTPLRMDRDFFQRWNKIKVSAFSEDDTEHSSENGQRRRKEEERWLIYFLSSSMPFTHLSPVRCTFDLHSTCGALPLLINCNRTDCSLKCVNYLKVILRDPRIYLVIKIDGKMSPALIAHELCRLYFAAVGMR